MTTTAVEPAPHSLRGCPRRRHRDVLRLTGRAPARHRRRCHGWYPRPSPAAGPRPAGALRRALRRGVAALPGAGGVTGPGRSAATRGCRDARAGITRRCCPRDVRATDMRRSSACNGRERRLPLLRGQQQVVASLRRPVGRPRPRRCLAQELEQHVTGRSNLGPRAVQLRSPVHQGDTIRQSSEVARVDFPVVCCLFKEGQPRPAPFVMPIGVLRDDPGRVRTVFSDE